MFATLTALILTPAVQHPVPLDWSQRNEVGGYRLAYVPKILQGKKPYAVAPVAGAVRGYKPIMSYWVMKKPFTKVAKEAFVDLTPDRDVSELTDEQLSRRTVAIFSKKLADRLITYTVMAGRPVVKKSGNMTSYEFDDQATYTRVQVKERPLSYGVKPKAWPWSAQNVQPLPKTIPSLPFKGITAKPSEWMTDMTPAGATQYWVDWYVPEEAASLVPRLTKEVSAGKGWIINPPSQVGHAYMRPVAKKNAFLWVDIEPAGKGWTRISATWSDASTGLRTR